MKKFIEYFSKRLSEEPDPKFHNRPNYSISANGREYWVSRSTAVVIVVLGIFKDNVFVLAEQRSEKMDEPFFWACPSGYLDWDETGYEGIIRELYEEVGIYIPDYATQLITNNEKQPFFVQTDPSENRQNVAINYCLIYDFEKTGLPKLQKNDEVIISKWIPIEQVMNKEMYTWAFFHDERISYAVTKFKEYLI